jgi:tetratricopeptide (TPR) repeat protein
LALVVVCAVSFESARAFEFRPTEAEFYSSPDYCKARFVTVNAGANVRPEWIQSVSKDVIAKSREALGSVMDAVHHYCAGTIWLNRARIEQDPYQKKFQLDSALGEMQYTARYTGPTLPLFAEVTVGMAMVEYERGNHEEALRLLRDAIAAAPNAAIAYSAMAVIYRSKGDLKKARGVLQEGDTALGGQSAEICYNLGLVELELSEPDRAVEYAQRAYALGYPLPGLRRKLERLGRWSHE